jgi:hypothetical protein
MPTIPKPPDERQLSLDFEPVDDAFLTCASCSQRSCDCDWAIQISFAAGAAGLQAVVMGGRGEDAAEG